jgi:hypothetical protein
LESIRITSKVSSVLDIVEHPRVCVKNGIDEAHGTFLDRKALFVDLVSALIAIQLLGGRGLWEITRVKTEANVGDAKLVPNQSDVSN